MVFVGKNEVTDAVLAELREALRAHELVKVKLLESVTERRNVVAKKFANRPIVRRADPGSLRGRNWLNLRGNHVR